MKTQNQLRKEQMFKASHLAYRLYQTEQEFVASEHDTPTVFFYSILHTISHIVSMKDSPSISKRTRKEYIESVEEVAKSACDDFYKDGDESSLIAGVMTFDEIVRHIHGMLQGEEVE